MNNQIDESIVRFIKKQRNASICCVDESGSPYCFSCYYAFDNEKGLLYFKSQSHTHHIKLIKTKNAIAGTILPDQVSLTKTKGIQFRGTVLDEQNLRDAHSFYHKRFPFAFSIPGEVWTIELSAIKMIDTFVKFGKKLFWERIHAL
jgi:uncharacterized protein YhbP (UPF0306 family)